MKNKIDVRLLTDSIFENWTISQIIGSGADGIVYSAFKDKGNIVALKIYFPEIVIKYGKESISERIELQTDLIGEKKHNNLVEIFEGGFSEEYQTFYLIMEKIEGKTLDKLIGKVPSDKIPELIKQLASVAEFLEKKQLVHRDIKPSNIIISDDFKTLTLLDLGIVHHFKNEDRLSGEDFVSTVRYCPPEFVWRTEDSENINAWRAITFYQIGAIMYELIMEEMLFNEYDKPRAKLYDAIRDITPNIQSKKVPSWLITTAQTCLMKDWRERIKYIVWDSFYEKKYAGTIDKDELDLKLLLEKTIQSNNEVLSQEFPVNNKLWEFNKQVIADLRNYFRSNNDIFPRCSTYEIFNSKDKYITEYRFENENVRYEIFKKSIIFMIEIKNNIDKEAFINIEFTMKSSVNSFDDRSYHWCEIFTVDTAIERLRSSFIDSMRLLVENKI